MSDLIQYTDWLNDFHYKPSWAFSIKFISGNYVRVEMGFKAEGDPSERIGKKDTDIVWGSGSIDLPFGLDEDEFYSMIRKSILWRENHETDEWIRIGSKRPWNPHRKGRVDLGITFCADPSPLGKKRGFFRRNT